MAGLCYNLSSNAGPAHSLSLSDSRMSGDSAKARFHIQYKHGVGGQPTVGAITNDNDDDSFSCNWELPDGTVAEPKISELDFMNLWNQLSVLKIFKDSLVKKKAKPEIDHASQHVVSVTYKDRDLTVEQTYLVPASNSDPEFDQWLKDAKHP